MRTATRALCSKIDAEFVKKLKTELADYSVVLRTESMPACVEIEIDDDSYMLIWVSYDSWEGRYYSRYGDEGGKLVSLFLKLSKGEARPKVVAAGVRRAIKEMA